jgi:hypothetical protein
VDDAFADTTNRFDGVTPARVLVRLAMRDQSDDIGDGDGGGGDEGEVEGYDEALTAAHKGPAALRRNFSRVHGRLKAAETEGGAAFDPLDYDEVNYDTEDGATWVPCRVLEYSSERQRFLIYWKGAACKNADHFTQEWTGVSHAGRYTWLPRLRIVFDTEDTEVFCERLKIVAARRQEAASRHFFSLYVRDVPDDGYAGMSKEQEDILHHHAWESSHWKWKERKEFARLAATIAANVQETARANAVAEGAVEGVGGGAAGGATGAGGGVPVGLSSGAASRPPTTGGGTGSGGRGGLSEGEAEKGDAEEILKAEVHALAEDAFKAQRRLVDERLAVEVKGVMDEVRSEFIFQMKTCAISYVPRARDGGNGKGRKTFKYESHLCRREARVWGAPVKMHCVCVCVSVCCMLMVCLRRVAAGCVLSISFGLIDFHYPYPVSLSHPPCLSFRFSLPVSLSSQKVPCCLLEGACPQGRVRPSHGSSHPRPLHTTLRIRVSSNI